MFQAFIRTLPRRYQAATVVVLGLGAVAGWSLLSGSRGSPAEPERQLSAPATELPTSQRATLPERDKALSPATEIPDLSMSSGFAQKEIARLAQEKILVQPKPVVARPALQARSSAGRQPQTGTSQTGLIARKPPTPPQAPVRRVSTAQAEAAPGSSKR
jgi:hypothetical protein